MRENNGHVPIPREVLNSFLPYGEREFTKAEAMLDLFLSACFKPGAMQVNNKPMQMNYGEVAASVRYLRNRWKWRSNDKVQNLLKSGQGLGILAVSKRTGQNVITVSFLANYYEEFFLRRTAIGQQSDTGRTAIGQQSDKEKERKKNKEKRIGVGASESLEISLVKRIGKDAAKIWTEGEMGEVLNGKSELALEWLEYRAGIQKPIRTYSEMTLMVEGFVKNPKERLRKMMDYSIESQYPRLYPDFDKKKTGAGADGFPNEWSWKIERKFTGPDLIEYYKHLKDNGFEKQTVSGQYAGWKKPKWK